MADTLGSDIGNQILAAVQGLGVRMDRLEARMDKLEARMDKLEAQVMDLNSRMTRQERLMEMLGAEFIKWRESLRADGTVVLMASVLRRPRDLGEALEKRLQELQTH